MRDSEMVRKLLLQQAALAAFGSFALQETDLQKILTEAARVCARGLGVPFCKVCRYRAEADDLLVEAGVGWKPGVVGHATSRANTTTPQGRAFITGQPAVCNDLRQVNDFVLPSFYAEHGIISTIDVPIGTGDRAYGVLEIDSDERQDYGGQDIDFLAGFANVLAEAIGTSERAVVLHTAIEHMHELVADKDRLLDQKRVLADELQHRVRNNLQLVYGMLSKQLEATQDHDGKRGIRAIARRVSTLAQVYDSLLGTGITRSMDLGTYVKALCANIAEFQAIPTGTIRLACHTEPVFLDLDTVTALGIIVAELVSNCYDHAFPTGKGSIIVSVRRSGASTARLTVSDNGRGFHAPGGNKRHGLGLARRLVEQIGGTATLESVHGTVWTIVFPAEERAAA